MSATLQSLAAVGGHTLLSRVLGFVRDLVIARVFGADINADAFLVAFKLPNLLRRLFVEGAFSLSLVPVLTEYAQQHSKEELRQFIARLAGTLIMMLVPLTILGVIAAPGLVAIFAPGFLQDPQRFVLTTTMLRITMPYLPLIIITAYAGAVFNSQKLFWVPAFTPVLLNLGMIAAAFWLAPYFEYPIMAVAWGIFIAGIVQITFQIPFLARMGLLARPYFLHKDPNVGRAFRLMGPAMLATSVTQLNLVFDTLLVSFLPIGSISWLYYANRLFEFPQGILGAALGTVILPQLATAYQEEAKNCSHQPPLDRMEVFCSPSNIIDRTLRSALLLGLPATVGLWVLAKPIMVTLFYSEQFTAQDVAMSAASLQIYALGLPAYLAVKVFTPSYYARADTHTPVRIALIVGVSNILLSIALMWPLAHLGLAWASTLAATLNGVLLWRGLVRNNTSEGRNFIYSASPGWIALLVRISSASLGMGIALRFASISIGDWLIISTSQNILHLALLILAAGGVYLAVLFLSGFRLQHLNINQK